MKLAFLFVFASLVSLAQSPITPEDRQKANKYFINGEWANSMAAYKKIADAEPQNSNARTRLGVSMTESGRIKDGIKELEQAVKISNNNLSMYYLGSAYAANHEADLAFQWLDKATANGFAFPRIFEEDKNFLALKSDPRLIKGKESILRNVYPCRYSAKSREFDFWVGEWDVTNLQGQPAGKSKIDLLVGDCVIFENWVNAPPALYTGKSINLYNSTTQKWIQTWFDDKGGLIEFINGEYKDNKMVFVTLPDPKNQITRLTFYNLGPDLVRQQFETTTDDGKNWKTTTDLNYHRAK